MVSKVLLVIVTYNAAGYITDCLSSLDKINYPKADLEILIIDNNSSDNSVELIKRNWPDVTVVANQANLGFAGGNNIGFRYAVDKHFDFVYLLNQDTEADPDFLINALTVAQTDSKIGAVQSKLLLFDDQAKINSIGNEIHYLGFGYAGGHKTKDHSIGEREITYPSGAASLFSVTALKDVGFFNEEFFMYHEDLDLGWRLWLAGYRIVLAGQSVVYHKYEFSRSIKKFYFMERNRRLVVFQNYKLGTLILIAPACLAMNLMMLGYSFIAGWHRELFRSYAYLLKSENWQKIKKTRQQVQSKRRVPDREVVKRFVGKIEFQDLNNPLLKYVVNPVFNFYWLMVRRFIWW
ncbi:MAG: glycosyltransferase family 2 protein [Candidatus Buchananbacteria bacterium]|nr:glycosyltransferase family 2 protein [Candidatus Buchananbacteria bacterium]